MQTIRVLHVDDDASFGALTSERLEAADDRLTVFEETTASNALDRLRQESVDCLVTDYDMPNMDGIALLEAVRQEWSDLPVILFTGKGSEAVASEAIASGATDYLQKSAGTEQFELLANTITNSVARYEAQRDLERKERRYQAMFEDPNLLVGVLDTDGRLEQVNHTALQFVEQTRENLVGTLFWETPWWSHSEAIQTDLQEWIARAADGEYVEFDSKNRVTDGSEINVNGLIRPVTDREGEVVSLIVSARNVTGQRDKEQRLREQNRKITALHRVATDIKTCDTPEAVYRTVVDAAEEILQLDIGIADAAVGESLVPRAVSSDLSADQYYEETPLDADDNLAAEAYRTSESILVEDLSEHDVSPATPEFRSVLTAPIGEHGVFQSVDRAVGAFDEDDRELTELLLSHAEARLDQLATEQRLRDRKEQLETFTNVVSHDLRNPLNLATTSLELVRAECDSEHIDTVEEGHTRMDALIEDLLARAKDETTASEFHTVDLAALSRDCWDAVATDEATLVVDLELSVPAHRSRLRQLLSNLFRNAIEHAGDDVTVRLGTVTDGFYVEDDGPGIPSEDQEAVFESGYTTATEGTGFGLSIVSDVAETHGWTVDITEGSDGGARFELRGV